MGYIKASDILPREVIEVIQSYIDGEYIYIPKLESNKKSWGENTNTKKEIRNRNNQIYFENKSGKSVKELSEKYYLSEKSIQRIITELRKKEKIQAGS